MDEHVIDAANEVVEETPTTDSSLASEETADVAPAEEKVTETQAFSKRLNEMSTKRAGEAVDKFVADMGLTNEYTGKPIATKAEYEAYKAMQKLDADGNSDPAAAYRDNSREAEVQRLRDEIRDRDLSSDPDKGETYKAVRDDVMALVEHCRSNGIACDIDSAFNTVLANQFWDLKGQAVGSAVKDALTKINNNAQASPGALSGEQPKDTADFSKMSDKEFDEYYNKAIRGGLRQS